MESQMSVRIALVLLAAAFLASTSTMVCVSARYLPTRSNEDRLERLRELLKDLFNSDYDQQNRAYAVPADIPMIPERAAIFKRSTGQSYPSGHDDVVKAMLSRNGVPAGLSTSAGGNGFVQLPVVDSSFLEQDRKGMK